MSGSAPTRLLVERWILERAVRRVDGGSRRHDLVDAVEDVDAEADAGGDELSLELFHGAGADQRAGDCRVSQHEADRELDQRQPGMVGELGEVLDRVELALVVRAGQVEALGQPCCPRRFLLSAALSPPPRQPAAREWAVAHEAHAMTGTSRQDISLDTPSEDRVWRLFGDEPGEMALPGHPLRLDNLARRER